MHRFRKPVKLSNKLLHLKPIFRILLTSAVFIELAKNEQKFFKHKHFFTDMNLSFD